jgi:hypothetical protein
MPGVSARSTDITEARGVLTTVPVAKTHDRELCVSTLLTRKGHRAAQPSSGLEIALRESEINQLPDGWNWSGSGPRLIVTMRAAEMAEGSLQCDGRAAARSSCLGCSARCDVGQGISTKRHNAAESLMLWSNMPLTMRMAAVHW